MEGIDVGNGKKDMPMNGLGTTGRLIYIYSYSSYFCSQLLFMYNLSSELTWMIAGQL